MLPVPEFMHGRGRPGTARGNRARHAVPEIPISGHHRPFREILERHFSARETDLGGRPHEVHRIRLRQGNEDGVHGDTAISIHDADGIGPTRHLLPPHQVHSEGNHLFRRLGPQDLQGLDLPDTGSGDGAHISTATVQCCREGDLRRVWRREKQGVGNLTTIGILNGDHHLAGGGPEEGVHQPIPPGADKTIPGDPTEGNHLDRAIRSVRTAHHVPP